MSITSTNTITVTNAQAVSASVASTVQPPASVGNGGRGRLVHTGLYPSGYDYPQTPDETLNVEVTASPAPLWLATQTLDGGAETKWAGELRGMRIVERWSQGDVGSTVAHLGALWAMFADPPDPDAGDYVVWTPNYASAASYNVVILDVRAGGVSGYNLQRRLAGFGYAPQPVELELRIISLVDP
jgi:hypothetical protein